MKKTIRIHITGSIFNIEEDAYVYLENWLEKIANQFENEDGGDEIINDIETRVAEIFQNELKDENGVISLKEVNKVIEIMGNPEDFENTETGSVNEPAGSTTESKRTGIRKRLFRDDEQRVFGGVCSGLSYYLGVDLMLIRIIFIALIFVGGFTAVLYLIMWIFIPVAETSSQKLEMKGEPVTITNIEKVIKTEFETVKNKLIKRKDSESFKSFTNDMTRFFDRLGEILVRMIKALGGVIGVILIIVGIALLIALFAMIFYHDVPWYIQLGNDTRLFYPFFHLFPLPFSDWIGSLALFLFIALPIVGIIFGAIRVIFRIKRSRTRPFRILGTTLWVIGLILTLFMVMNYFNHYRSQKTVTKTYVLEETGTNMLHLRMNNTYIKKFDDPEFRIANYHVIKSDDEYKLLGMPDLNISKSKDKETKLKLIYNARGESEGSAAFQISRMNWRWIREDTVMLCDPYFTVSENNKLYLRDLSVNLEVPVGKVIFIDSTLINLINDVEISEYMHSNDIFEKKLIMTEKGLALPSDTTSDSPVIKEIQAK